MTSLQGFRKGYCMSNWYLFFFFQVKVHKRGSLSVKMVYKRARAWTLGQSLLYRTLWCTPNPASQKEMQYLALLTAGYVVSRKWLCNRNWDKLGWCGPLQPENSCYDKGKATTSSLLSLLMFLSVFDVLSAGLQNVPWFFTSDNKLECGI